MDGSLSNVAMDRAKVDRMVWAAAPAVPRRWLALAALLTLLSGLVLAGNAHAALAPDGMLAGESGENHFGRSVAVSANGNTALVGAPTDDGEAGAVTVFTRIGATWTQKAELTPTSGEAVGKGGFGSSVALSSDGNTAIVGAPGENGGAGAAWVFTRSESGVWSQQGEKLTGSGEEGEGQFGQSVALSSKGDTALVGGPGDAGRVGAAWVFMLSGESWSQFGAKLTGTGESGEGEFGLSVALSKDASTALIGAPGDSSKVGGAWLFTCSSEGACSQQGEKLTGGGESGAGELGRSVGLSSEGNTALLGGPADDINTGAAWVFTRSQAAAWTQQGNKLTGNGETGEGSFGSSVALSSDGAIALVGGPADNTGVGAAWLFTRSEADAWALQGGKLSGSSEEGEGQFGGSVAVSSDGHTALVGGPADNANMGAAWAFVNPPTVSDVTPNKGPQTGGTSVTVTGTNFNEAAAVEFGASGATSFEVISATVITAVAPAGAGTADVSVTTSGGTSAPSSTDKFSYVPAPTVVTEAPSSITQTTATLNASVNPNGGEVSNCTFEYGTTELYEFSKPCSLLPGSGSEPVAVSAALEDLSANTVYRFRIVATSLGGTSADILNVQTFKTLPNAPTVVTKEASAIAQTTATLHAGVNPNGGEVTSCEFDYGTSEAYGTSVPCSSLLGSGSSPVAVAVLSAGLSPDTTYHFRIVAENAGGASSGSDQTFKTLPEAPTVVTEVASSVGQSSATLNGTVNPNGGTVTSCHFDYGTTIGYGHEVACSSLPGSGDSAVGVSASVTGLSANTTYHFRVVATNAGGTGTGGDEIFRTLPDPPTVVTGSGTAVTQTTVTLNATVNPNRGEVSDCFFEYGATGSYGHSVACMAAPGAGASPVAVSASVMGLIKDTTYHFRIVATNAGGMSPGADQTFETAPGPPTVIVAEPSAIGQVSAVLNAEINPNGGVITQCYFHYESLTAKPQVTITPCVGLPLSGKSPVKVSALAEGLSASTRYSVSLEVINSFGEDAFGERGMPFETLPGPEVVTGAASSVAQTSAMLNALVNPNGGEVSSCEFEYGTSEAYGSKPIPCESQPGAGDEQVPVSAKLQGLSANTKYFFRIVATNPGGTSKDTVGQTFTTLPNAPVLATGEVMSVTQTAASVNATVDENGGRASACQFEYGPTTSYGSTVPCTPSPEAGAEPVAVGATLMGLSPNTTYHVRIVATNPGGTSAGEDQTFTTLPDAPTVLTAAVSSLTQTSATLRASVNPNGARVSACQFDYGVSASYGSSVPCAALPGTGTVPVTVSASLGGLSANTTYHFRIVATNTGGTSPGLDQAFTTEAFAMRTATATPAPATATTATNGMLSATFAVAAANCRTSLTSATVAVQDDGMAAVKLSWTGTGTGTSMCSGKLMLRARVKARSGQPKTVLIGSGGFSLPAGGIRSVTLKIDGVGRGLFSAAHGRLSASLSILKLSPGPTEAQTKAVVLARPAHSPIKRR